MGGAMGTVSHSDFKCAARKGLMETMSHYFLVTQRDKMHSNDRFFYEAKLTDPYISKLGKATLTIFFGPCNLTRVFQPCRRKNFRSQFFLYHFSFFLLLDIFCIFCPFSDGNTTRRLGKKTILFGMSGQKILKKKTLERQFFSCREHFYLIGGIVDQRI